MVSLVVVVVDGASVPHRRRLVLRRLNEHLFLLFERVASTVQGPNYRCASRLNRVKAQQTHLSLLAGFRLPSTCFFLAQVLLVRR